MLPLRQTALLLSAGAPIDVTEAANRTALHMAVDRGSKPVTRSKPGVTTLDLAREFKNSAAIEILEKLGKNPVSRELPVNLGAACDELPGA